MINRLPPWFKQEIPQDAAFKKNLQTALKDLGLHTVCVSAHCPNITSCSENNNITFMIMGNSCSRSCRFCAVSKDNLKPLDLFEVYNLALKAKDLNLKYAVITSVTRDDLVFGGATHFIRAVYLLKQASPGIRIELLIPDFKGKEKPLSLLARAPAQIIAHNLETVERIFSSVRPDGKYQLSLYVLKKIKKIGFAGFTKSGIMLGFGEREEEVLKTMRDLRGCDCDILTLGQYLAPSKNHAPVEEFISPEKFESYRKRALALGFRFVNSGPLVRSSYQAKEAYEALLAK